MRIHATPFLPPFSRCKGESPVQTAFQMCRPSKRSMSHKKRVHRGLLLDDVALSDPSSHLTREFALVWALLADKLVGLRRIREVGGMGSHPEVGASVVRLQVSSLRIDTNVSSGDMHADR